MPRPLNSLELNLAAQVWRACAGGQPTDAALRQAVATGGRGVRSAMPAVADALFAIDRWRGWLHRDDPLARLIGQAHDLQQRFDRQPGSFSDAELLERAVPSWVFETLAWPASAGSGPADPVRVAWVRRLQSRPTLWIRARSGQADSLAEELGNCRPPPATVWPHPTTALAFAGSNDLLRTAAFHEGRLEIQDLASQWVGCLSGAQPGETWWDACAGGGGKTLHLAELMANQGLLWASDRSASRLSILRRRAARAKVFNYRTAAWDGSARLPTRTRFDGVLLDAPCSGVGTWQRNAHARWSTTPEDLRVMATRQLQLLENVSAALPPGGRLLYAVCTLTRSETIDVARAFSLAHPDFVPFWPAPWAGLGVPAAPAAQDGDRPAPGRFLWPQFLGSGGMYAALWRKGGADPAPA